MLCNIGKFVQNIFNHRFAKYQKYNKYKKNKK